MSGMEIIKKGNPSTIVTAADMTEAFAQVAQAMHGMADMVRATNDRMAELEKQVRLLTKVTPLQATNIGAAIRERAAELCATYRMAGSEKAAAGAIRKDVRLMHGVQNLRELPRCEYAVVMQQVQLWDDYKAMKRIKAKASAQTLLP